MAALSSAVLSVRRVDVDSGWDAGNLAAWEDAGLSPMECAAARSGPALSHRKRSQWLAGRIAAKDAVLDLLTPRQPGLSSWGRRDIELWPQPSGALGVRCTQGTDDDSFLVSVSHSRTRAVALAVVAGDVASVGVDIEGHGSWPVVWRQGLAADERAALSPQLRGSAERGLVHRVMGLWCAKEAAMKAWRTGFAAHGGPRNVVAHYSGDHRVVVRPGRRLPHLPAIEARVTTWPDLVREMGQEWTMAIAVVSTRGYACAT